MRRIFAGVIYYEQLMGAALLVYADNLDAFVQVLIDEGETDLLISANDVISYQQRLAAQGFTPQETANAHLLGLTDAEIEAYRLEIIAANPSDLAGNTLAQIDNAAGSVQVGNLLTQTAVIDLHARRIDLPADWMVSVSPAQVTLASGEVTTVTVSVLTGSLVPQGAIPRVAIEGFLGDQLLGGVAIEIVVPRYVHFDGEVHLYLPILAR